MAYDGYRSPRSEHGFSEYAYPGSRSVDPRAVPAYSPSNYQPSTSSQHGETRDHRDIRDYSRSSATQDGYSSDPTRDSTYQPHYPASTSERTDPVNYDYPPEILAHIKATVKEELMKELKTAGTLQVETGVPLTRTRSAQPSYTPPNPDYSTYTSPSNTQGYFNTIPRDQGLRVNDRPPRSPSSDSGPVRPRAPRTSTSGSEPTALDRTWGQLFDNGNPTPRLGELLRGLANHIVSLRWCYPQDVSCLSGY
jgi:hypothetical protein